jgi:hypothetical protein
MHMTTTAFMTAVVTTAQGSCLGTRFALKVS